MKYLSWSLLIGAAAVLAACGGGNGSSSGVGTTTPPPVTTTPPVTAQSTNFTSFVKDQWAVAQTADPVPVEKQQFTFPDDNNPQAFDDLLKQTGQ